MEGKKRANTAVFPCLSAGNQAGSGEEKKKVDSVTRWGMEDGDKEMNGDGWDGREIERR